MTSVLEGFWFNVMSDRSFSLMAEDRLWCAPSQTWFVCLRKSCVLELNFHTHVHFHDLSGAGRPSGTDRVVRLRCVAHHHVTGRRVHGVSCHLLTQTHTERGKPHRQPEITSILFHRCGECHGIMGLFLGEMFNGAHMPNSGKALSLTTVSVFDTSFLSASPIGHAC